jgi:hypothetical protein
MTDSADMRMLPCSRQVHTFSDVQHMHKNRLGTRVHKIIHMDVNARTHHSKIEARQLERTRVEERESRGPLR